MAKIFKIKQFIDNQWIEYVLNDEMSELNIQNGTGEGSLQQKTYTDVSKNPQALGLGSVALGGFRGDKPNETPDTVNLETLVPEGDDITNTAIGIQSFVTGAGNLAAGNWSFASGKDNRVYQRNSHALGGGNIVGRTPEDFAAAYPNGIDEYDCTYENSYSHSFAAGSMNIARGRNLIALGTNLVTTGRNKVVVGKFNKNVGAIFIVGAGADEGHRKNIITCYENTATLDCSYFNIYSDIDTEEDRVNNNPSFKVWNGTLTTKKDLNVKGNGYISGKLQVTNAPVNDNDVIRLQELKPLQKLIEGLTDAQITALNNFAKSLVVTEE